MAETREKVLLGKSILAHSVKELADQTSLETIPKRYIFYDDDNYNNEGGDNCSSDVQIPIIDMQALISEDEIELQRLHSACKEWGFFQLVHHGVSSSLIEKFKVETQEFFDLPPEEKKKYCQTETDAEEGFKKFKQNFAFSGVQKLDWADTFILTTLPKHQRRSHLLPMLPLPFRETLDSYAMELGKLGMNIIECMAKALKVEVEVMRDAFGEGHQAIRMAYYPPCSQPNKAIGLAPHSDADALTILLQLNEVEGLEIKKDDKWISIKPLPNAFIINLGDVMEIMSNGIYRSALHRAVVNAFKERLSVSAFYSVANDREIGPIPSLITTKNPAKFRRISMVDYMKRFFAKTLDEKSYLDMMRIS